MSFGHREFESLHLRQKHGRDEKFIPSDPESVEGEPRGISPPPQYIFLRHSLGAAPPSSESPYCLLSPAGA